jgi:lipoprotein-releasing system ATP-binding protein
VARIPKAKAREMAAEALKRVGMGHRLQHKPGELSGGEQQRVAIARALLMGPGLVLADEPTGNLDPRTADEVMTLLLDLNRAQGATLVVVTHSMELARRFPRVVRVVDGALKEAA